MIPNCNHIFESYICKKCHDSNPESLIFLACLMNKNICTSTSQILLIKLYEIKAFIYHRQIYLSKYMTAHVTSNMYFMIYVPSVTYYVYILCANTRIGIKVCFGNITTYFITFHDAMSSLVLAACE